MKQKIQTLGRSDQPFSTSNAALAFALYSAGMPFADSRHPCYNVYDSGNLKNLGYAGLTLEEAANTAFEAGRKGHITYVFQRTSKLGRLLKAYAAMEKEFTESDVLGTELVSKIIKSVAAKSITEEEGIVRLACVNLKMRSVFMNQWKKQVPMVRVDNPGKPATQQTQNGTVVSYPGYKIVGLNLSEKKRAHLKL